jgi:signal transduction histidine kinase
MSRRGRFVTASSVVALVTLSGPSSAVWLAYGAAKEGQLEAALLAEATKDAIDPSYTDDPVGRPALRRGELGHITKYAAIYDSNGQALAIRRSTARAHGGDLRVDDWAHGARFVVRLPVSGPTAGT